MSPSSINRFFAAFLAAATVLVTVAVGYLVVSGHGESTNQKKEADSAGKMGGTDRRTSTAIGGKTDVKNPEHEESLPVPPPKPPVSYQPPPPLLALLFDSTTRASEVAFLKSGCELVSIEERQAREAVIHKCCDLLDCSLPGEESRHPTPSRQEIEAGDRAAEQVLAQIREKQRAFDAAMPPEKEVPRKEASNSALAARIPDRELLCDSWCPSPVPGGPTLTFSESGSCALYNDWGWWIAGPGHWSHKVLVATGSYRLDGKRLHIQLQGAPRQPMYVLI